MFVFFAVCCFVVVSLVLTGFFILCREQKRRVDLPRRGLKSKNRICWVMKLSFQFLDVRIGGGFVFGGFCFSLGVWLWCVLKCNFTAIQSASG